MLVFKWILYEIIEEAQSLIFFNKSMMINWVIQKHILLSNNADYVRDIHFQISV